MKDINDKIIYIGKATSLKKRVSSYFQKTNHDPRIKILVKNIHNFECIITDSEIEALLLESALIKKHKPRYNVKLKDDKRYPYIVVTLSEAYPRIIITRRLLKNNDRYFGPYTDARAARNIVSTINAIFKLRLCKKDLPLKANKRPCLNYQIKKCNGLCANKISQEQYTQIVSNAIHFLEGKIKPVLTDLKNLMEDYSRSQKYEDAAQIRDIIYDIQKVSEKQKVYAPTGLDKDYIGIQIQGNEGIIIIFEFKNGVLLGTKISIYEDIELSNNSKIIKSFIIDYYDKHQPPSGIITQYKIDDKKIIEEHLAKKSAKKVHITLPIASEDKGIINMIQKNLDVMAAERLAHQKIRDKKKGLLELKNVLNLTAIPEIIECFDISNIQGKNSVASMVRFKEGIPEKSSYRRYRIKSLDSPNDPGMIHEAVGRRLQYLVNEEFAMPDLIVIDGGKAQLNKALEVKHALNIDSKIISIAKRQEEIFTEKSDDSIILKKSSPALKIIQNIRDEAHRFAIEYHRKLRSKDIKKSFIDEIPNIGEKTKKLLLKHLKSVKKIKISTKDELIAIPGIGEKSAETIYNFFQKK